MTKEVATRSKASTLRELLKTYKSEIAAALPRHVSPDRLARIAMTSARKNPALLECSPESFLGAVIVSAQLGLEPDTPLGHAYLVPFFNKDTGQKEVNFMPGYRGLMDLVYRVAHHPIITAEVVYEVDRFAYEKGLYPKLEHAPMPREAQTKLTHAYAVASFADGRKEFVVMPKSDIEARRLRSKATGFSPWKTDYAAMAKKTVIRDLVKFMPMSAELQTAVGLDEIAEIGKSQNNDSILKTGLPKTKQERIEGKMAQEPDEPPDPDSFEAFSER